MVCGAARARARARAGAALDGDLPGLSRGRRRGGDDRADRHESVPLAAPFAGLAGRCGRTRANSMGRETGLAGENAPRPMAFRDFWHRALVYFGLAEEYHDDYDEPPAETEI